MRRTIQALEEKHPKLKVVQPEPKEEPPENPPKVKKPYTPRPGRGTAGDRAMSGLFTMLKKPRRGKADK